PVMCVACALNPNRPETTSSRDTREASARASPPRRTSAASRVSGSTSGAITNQLPQDGQHPGTGDMAPPLRAHEPQLRRKQLTEDRRKHTSHVHQRRRGTVRWRLLGERDTGTGHVRWTATKTCREGVPFATIVNWQAYGVIRSRTRAAPSPTAGWSS